MRPKLVSRSWGLVLACASTALARDDAPPLIPPAESSTPPATVAPPAAQPATPSPRTNAIRPIPRLLRTPSFIKPAQPESSAPPLLGPAEMGTTPPPTSAPLFTPSPRRGGPPPLTLESSPLDGTEPLPGPRLRSSAARPFDPESVTPPTSQRRFRLFGRFLPGAQPRASELKAERVDEPVKAEPRSDPAVDAALKRRVEAQIRDAVGSQLRSLDVRVVDHSVAIHARPVRFWQRRSVRRTIESLPILSGYKATIEVDE